ncbi:MAG: epoxyqueuosine reductase [Deltaproteobacteria bacterium]|nr:MAG: epoxyqueuosine reductase [Deltaproteobacteria bacterium]
MSGLENEIRGFLQERGAIRVGFASLETLAGGPPSADLTYVLPEARSAVSFALPLDLQKIRATLAKKSHNAFEKNNIEVNVEATNLSIELARWLEERGHKARGTFANNFYRQEVKGWQRTLPPDVSHRYVTVRSGVASFGWSGNVGIKGYGSSIILDTTVTSVELEATDPIPEEDSYCDRCKLCVTSCPSGFFEKDKETSITLGGKTFTHAARNSYALCFLVCGGFTGISKDGKWSTFSPGRMEVPENATEAELFARLQKAIENYKKWPRRSDGDGGYENVSLKGVNMRLTCGCCQIVCAKDKKARTENYKLLKNSGCVIQREDGDIVVLPPEEAAKEFEKMDPAHKALYTDAD